MLCWTSYKLLETLKYWSVSSHFLTGKIVNVWQRRTTDIPNLKCLECSIFSSLTPISLLVCYPFVIIILSFIQGFFSRVPREIVIKKICKGFLTWDLKITLKVPPGNKRGERLFYTVIYRLVYYYLLIVTCLLLPAYYCLAVC